MYARAAAADDAASPGTGPESALIDPTRISESLTPGASDGAVHGAGPPPDVAEPEPDATAPPDVALVSPAEPPPAVGTDAGEAEPAFAPDGAPALPDAAGRPVA